IWVPRPAGDRLVRVGSDEPGNALAAGAQLLGFGLLGALWIIVRLQEGEAGTLPIAGCTCLLLILLRLVSLGVGPPHVATPCCVAGAFGPPMMAKCRPPGRRSSRGPGRRRSPCGHIIGTQNRAFGSGRELSVRKAPAKRRCRHQRHEAWISRA